MNGMEENGIHELVSNDPEASSTSHESLSPQKLDDKTQMKQILPLVSCAAAELSQIDNQ